MSIFEDEAKRQLIVALQSLAPEDLDTLIRVSACTLSFSEAKEKGIIARIIRGKSYDYSDIARFFYYTSRH